MRTSSKKRFDFFTEYHKEKLSKIASYLFSGMFALALAFSFVSYSQNGNLGGLMASVSNLTRSEQYDADLVLQKSGNSLGMIFGSTAEKVDSIGFTLLSDPAHFRAITSTDSSVAISPLGEGMFRIVKTFKTETIPAGTTIAVLQVDMDAGISVNLIDTEFTSEWVKYSLTNKSE